MAQETQTGVLCKTRGVEWVRRWERGSKGRGYMYTYGWFMLRFDWKQQNPVKQLSFNKKLKNKKKEMDKNWGRKWHLLLLLFSVDNKGSSRTLQVEKKKKLGTYLWSRGEDNQNAMLGTSLVVQWLRFWALNVRGPNLIPGQGTRSHMPQLRVWKLQLKIPCATTKIHHSQINMY